MYAGIIGGCPDNENGKWNEGKRSVSSDIPITIYVENGQLVIKESFSAIGYNNPNNGFFHHGL